MDLSKGLAGKYFINAMRGPKGQVALMRGLILGPIATELSPFYLCDVYPADDVQIAITTQTIMPLEQLVGVYLYGDRTEFQAAWVELTRRIAAEIAERQQQAQVEMRQRAMQQAEVFAAALKKQGIQTVKVSGDPVELAQFLAGQVAAMSAAEAGGADGGDGDEDDEDEGT